MKILSFNGKNIHFKALIIQKNNSNNTINLSCVKNLKFFNISISKINCFLNKNEIPNGLKFCYYNFCSDFLCSVYFSKKATENRNNE